MNVLYKGIETKDLQSALRPRPADGHKGTFGHALLIAGSEGMAGAAILSAEACLRSGIGKLTVLTTPANRPLLQTTVPEAIVRCGRNLGFIGENPSDFPYQAIGIGPGLGESHELLSDCLRRAECPMVLDADALNMLATRTEWQDLLPPDSILTPHPGEAQRLIGSSEVAEVAAYARVHHVFVVLKGHPSHVCTPDGTVYALPVGNSGMATAGSGDVLTGLITGLLAQRYTPLSAALLGVWLHGTAGDISADEMGEICMLARDIIRHLPQAFKKLCNP